MNHYTKPLPRTEDLDNAPHWVAAHVGELKFQCCSGCGHMRFPAAPICPACRSRAAEWKTASGRGVIESYCRFHKAYWPGFKNELPYTVVQVLLDCGVRMYSNMVDVKNDDFRIGTSIEAAFVTVTPEVTLIRFRPIQD